MYKITGVLLFLLTAMGAAVALTCGWDQPAAVRDQVAGAKAEPPASAADALATVNGTLIGEADIRFALRDVGHDKEVPAQHRRNVLEVIIGRELIAQEAVRLGLDANPSYLKKLRRLEAQINAFKRKELSELFFRREIAQRRAVSEADAKRYYAEHTEQIRSEIHVWQILLRTEAAIGQVRDELLRGASFEKVAARRFPKRPATSGAPWDLGYLKWKQVPKSWRDVVYELAEGEVSGVIRGPNNRFWIVKLIDKRQDPRITFESIKPTVVEVLTSATAAELRERTLRGLRAKAKILYFKPAVEAPKE